MTTTTTLPILHFNDVYRVKQTSRALGGTITADQFAAKIAGIRTSWGEKSRALDFLDDEQEEKDVDNQQGSSTPSGPDGNGGQRRRKGQQPLGSSTPSGPDGNGGQRRRKGQQPLKGLVLFSGDVFNPSIESSVTRGEHMIDILNACSIDCSCLGNHDFDFGYPHLQTLIKQTNFPWTFTNIANTDHETNDDSTEEPKATDQQVDCTVRSWVCEVKGVRIGCIGLVEKDWIATVPSFPPTFRYRSMVLSAQQASKELRDPQGEHRCDLVIALTHCRLPNDIDLANALGATKDASDDEHGVDLVLGGHDHTYYVGNGIDDFQGEDWKTDLPGQEKDSSCLLVKSGTDFHDLSEIELDISEPKEASVRRRRIIGARVVRHSTKPSDPTLPELKEHIDQLMERVDEATGQPVAFTLTPLDCRMGQVRTDESATGNLIADILMHSYDDALKEMGRSNKDSSTRQRPEGARQVDMTLICGGSLRGDAVFGPGTIAVRDILSIMPFEDAVVVKELKGQDIWDALENGFGAYPSQEGRFPHVAGLSIVWDSRKPSGQRLVEVCLLDDVHLFHSDGRRKSDAEVDAADSHSYNFERSSEGGYSIDVNRPKIRKGKKLEMDKLYRVCTREYMADGHDGFEALMRGRDLIDHENGSLMSTLVRKFLLGASLIWRLKSFRESSDDQGRGVVGHTKLTNRTMRAIQRAQALRGDTTNPASSPSAAANTTPIKGKILQGLDHNSRVVIDSSPGGIRDAIHAGSSEHHSQYDAASKMFKGRPRRGSRAAAAAAAGPPPPPPPPPPPVAQGSPTRDRRSYQSSAGQSSSNTTSAHAGEAEEEESNDSIAGLDDSSVGGLDSSLFIRHVNISPEDGEVLRQSEADLAIIAPLTDGRMVNLARTESGQK